MHPRSIEDVRWMARQLGIQKPGLASLTASLLGHSLRKTECMTTWSSEDLSEAQLLYAATDSWVTRKLGLLLRPRIAVLIEKLQAGERKRQERLKKKALATESEGSSSPAQMDKPAPKGDNVT